MKKALITLSILPFLGLSVFAQKTENQRQYDEVSRELSLGIHNIEKSLVAYSEDKGKAQTELLAVMESSKEIVSALQDAQTDYNVEMNDENFQKLQDLRRQQEKSSAVILKNMTDSVLTDIAYVEKLSSDYYVLSTYYAKFDKLRSSMQGGSADELAMLIKEKKEQIAFSANMAKDLLGQLPDAQKDKLTSTLVTMQNEFRNTKIESEAGGSVSLDSKKQVALLKDASAQLANYAKILEIDKDRIAMEALKAYEAQLASQFEAGSVVAVHVDPVENLRKLREEREEQMAIFKKNMELANGSKRVSGREERVDTSELDGFLDSMN